MTLLAAVAAQPEAKTRTNHLERGSSQYETSITPSGRTKDRQYFIPTA